METKESQFGTKANLPFLIDGEFFLSESQAIPAYLILKSGQTDLLGKNPQDRARVRQISGVLQDVIQDIFKNMRIPGDFKANAQRATSNESFIATKFLQLEEFLGEKEYFLGYLTWADFLATFICQFVQVYTHSFGLACPGCQLPHLAFLRKKVEALPKVSERLAESKTAPFLFPKLVKFPLHTLADC